jgi:hypothetical protein
VSIQLLEEAAALLEPVLDEVAFVGAATLVLWITDPAAPEIRPTRDVDVIVEVFARPEYHRFEQRLRELGFREDQASGVICRWNHRVSGLILDAMPADAGILGFENEWQKKALPHAPHRELPSGRRIRAVPPAYLLATKLEAFAGRGNDDFLGGRDFADIVTLIDGREAIVPEVTAADIDLRTYVATQFRRLMQDPRFEDGVAGGLAPDAGSQARLGEIVMPRIRRLADAAPIGDEPASGPRNLVR